MGVVPASKTLAMQGWSMSASAWRSASKRASTSRESIPALISLRATVRRTGWVCSARQTSPMPPLPIRSRRVYCPRVRPDAARELVGIVGSEADRPSGRGPRADRSCGDSNVRTDGSSMGFFGNKAPKSQMVPRGGCLIVESVPGVSLWDLGRCPRYPYLWFDSRMRRVMDLRRQHRTWISAVAALVLLLCAAGCNDDTTIYERVLPSSSRSCPPTAIRCASRRRTSSWSIRTVSRSSCTGTPGGH